MSDRMGLEDLLRHQIRDSRAWALAWTDLHGGDTDLVHAILANAMMAMHDSIHNNEIKKLQAENEALKSQLEKAEAVIAMVEDWRKMPHQHSDAHTRLCCLTERASEYFREKGVMDE